MKNDTLLITLIFKKRIDGPGFDGSVPTTDVSDHKVSFEDFLVSQKKANIDFRKFQRNCNLTLSSVVVQKVCLTLLWILSPLILKFLINSI